MEACIKDNRVIIDHYNVLNDTTVAVEHYTDFQQVIIVGEREFVNIPYENIPALIVMLKSICNPLHD